MQCYKWVCWQGADPSLWKAETGCIIQNIDVWPSGISTWKKTLSEKSLKQIKVVHAEQQALPGERSSVNTRFIRATRPLHRSLKFYSNTLGFSPRTCWSFKSQHRALAIWGWKMELHPHNGVPELLSLAWNWSVVAQQSTGGCGCGDLDLRWLSTSAPAFPALQLPWLLSPAWMCP